MQDLNVNMFYKAKFDILSKEERPDEDLLWKLVLSIRAWIVGKLNQDDASVIDSRIQTWTGFKFGSKLYDLENKNRVFCESVCFNPNGEDPSHLCWACKIVENITREAVAPRQWVTEIGYEAQSIHRATISYVISYSDAPGFIGLCDTPPSPNIPRIIRWLLNDPELCCMVGSSPLSISPIPLEPGDYPKFKETLLDPHRQLPIIYVSPRRKDADSEETELLVDVQALATNVAASALVYYADSLNFTQEMRYLGHSSYLCTGGALRVYFPNLNPEAPNDSYRHRFLPASFMEAQGSDQIISILRRALAQDVHYYETLFRISNCKALAEQASRQEKLDRIRKSSQAETDEAVQEYLAEADLRQEAEDQVQSLKDELKAQKAEAYSLSLQLQAQEDTVQKFSQISQSVDKIRAISAYPSSPEEIARYFETAFPERIAFTERAYQSMKSCITKKEILWEAFHHMAVELYDLLQEHPATAFKDFQNMTGWECSRGEGSQTRDDKRLMRQYVDHYNGQEIDIESHVKNMNKESDSRFVRIYFAYEPNVANKIIIGHCGKHLENYSSRKIK